MFKFKVISDNKDLLGKKVLLRLDLNVPVDNAGEIEDDYRIRKALPTIELLQKSGAKIIIISHIGRDPNESLEGVSKYCQKFFNHHFLKDIFSDKTKDYIDKMNDGDIVVLENLRQNKGEVENDKDFVDKLAGLGEIYVNEAFSNSHRDHASMTGLPKLMPAYAGLRFDQEVRMLGKAFNPPDPFLLIVGGAKFETKLPLVKKFSSIANLVFLGGALANDVFRYYGFNVGQSLVSSAGIEDIESIIDTGRVITPADVLTEKGNIKDPRHLSDDDKIVDSGKVAVEVLSKLIFSAKFIIWNGPLGVYEDGYIKATEEIAKAVIDSDAEAIIGGGDTAVAVSKFEHTDEQVFISTGGGAMLDFLADERLVAIDALEGSLG